ncbi:hypothetical protein PYW07_006429 [Mythimna separata]|uniref:Fucosyltransferase n=1 Tax=Mythimna separata TaxID=271217 RepID=A0AAD8DWR2_MYTSE|nr:hypothetical protein PYW07_006429 [Mythimna separata]
MENSFDEDYVTEKLLTALQHNMVPIVYGGADYTRFLPPGSYIDARKHNITELAAKIDKLIQSPKDYSQYFWWKDYYSYHDPKEVENVCAMCEALHSNDMRYTFRSYHNFRDWWNPKGRCTKNEMMNEFDFSTNWAKFTKL